MNGCFIFYHYNAVSLHDVDYIHLSFLWNFSKQNMVVSAHFIFTKTVSSITVRIISFFFSLSLRSRGSSGSIVSDY
jgi:hypothetical protein